MEEFVHVFGIIFQGSIESDQVGRVIVVGSALTGIAT